MGGSSLKKIFAHVKKKQQKKKKSPLNKAWKKVRRALPTGRHVTRSLLSPGKLRKRKKKKQPPSLKRLALGNKRKESTEAAAPEEEEEAGGALGKLGQKIKRKLSRADTKGQVTKEEGGPAAEDTGETRGRDGSKCPKHEEKAAKRKLKDVVKAIRRPGSKAQEDSG